MTTLSNAHLQALIDATPDGGTLTVPAGDYFGPIRLMRPITIEGQSSAVWVGARSSPVVSIESPGVLLRRVTVEALRAGEMAIIAEVGTAPRLEEVNLVGDVLGVPVRELPTISVRLSSPPPLHFPPTPTPPIPPLAQTSPVSSLRQPPAKGPGVPSAEAFEIQIDHRKPLLGPTVWNGNVVIPRPGPSGLAWFCGGAGTLWLLAMLLWPSPTSDARRVAPVPVRATSETAHSLPKSAKTPDAGLTPTSILRGQEGAKRTFGRDPSSGSEAVDILGGLIGN